MTCELGHYFRMVDGQWTCATCGGHPEDAPIPKLRTVRRKP